jgi:hypothetical protein
MGMEIYFHSVEPGVEEIIVTGRGVVGTITRHAADQYAVTWVDSARAPLTADREGLARIYAYGAICDRPTKTRDQEERMSETTKIRERALNPAPKPGQAGGRKRRTAEPSTSEPAAAVPIRYKELKGAPLVDGGRFTCACGATFTPEKAPADQQRAMDAAWRAGWRWPKGIMVCPDCRAKAA